MTFETFDQSDDEGTLPDQKNDNYKDNDKATDNEKDKDNDNDKDI